MKQTDPMFLWKTTRLINSETHFSLEIARPSEEEKLKHSVHWHDYFEFEIMLSGRSQHYLNNESHTISRGSAHLLRYSDFHTNIPLENETVRLYNFNFDEAALPSSVITVLLNAKEPFVYKYSEEELSELINDIKTLQDPEADLSNPLVCALHSAIFTKIVLGFINKCGTVPPKVNKGSTALALNNAVSIIRCKFREDITLTQLARTVGLTPNHLGYLFKIQLGESFNEYLKKVRLKHAKSLLKHSDLSIYSVSDYSGFKNPSYFIKCFKQMYGITPRQYVLTLIENNKIITP